MTVKLKVNNKDGSFDKEIEVPNKKSLLDEMLDKNVEVYFGCMGGSCSACKCKILKGMEHIDKEAMGPQVYKDVAEDEVLSCIAKVKDEAQDVEIEIQKVL